MTALVAALGLILVTVAVHVSGLYVLTLRLLKIGDRGLSKRGSPYLLCLVVSLTLFIVMLHMFEVWIWAAFYLAAAGFDDWQTAVYFSLGSYSTVGSDQVVLSREWRVLGPVEGILGTLMFGLSAAFLFAVLIEMHRRRQESALDA